VGSLWNSLEYVYTSLRNKDLERRLLLIFLTKHLEGNAYSQLWVYSIKKKKKERKKGEKKTSLEKQHLFLEPPSRQGP
jgi:hypothetical protein